MIKNCAICELEMLPHTVTRHHLVPKEIRKKTNKGSGIIKLHKFCHTIVHIIFSNEDLAEKYSTKKELLAAPPIIRLKEFIQKSPTKFYINSDKSSSTVKEVRTVE